MTRLSVVSPLYRAAGCIDELYRRLDATLRSMNVEHEIVLVEDCGGDGSAEAIARIAAADEHVVALLLRRNVGQHAAIARGLARATGEWVVVMDCDLQDRPEEIPRLFDAATAGDGADVVLARRLRRRHSLFRRAASRLWFALINRSRALPIDPAFGTFSLIHRRVVDAYLQTVILSRPTSLSLLRAGSDGEGAPAQDDTRPYLLLLHSLPFRRRAVDVEHAERFEGRSSYGVVRLLRHALAGLRTSHRSG